MPRGSQRGGVQEKSHPGDRPHLTLLGGGARGDHARRASGGRAGAKLAGRRAGGGGQGDGGDEGGDHLRGLRGELCARGGRTTSGDKSVPTNRCAGWNLRLWASRNLNLRRGQQRPARAARARRYSIARSEHDRSARPATFARGKRGDSRSRARSERPRARATRRDRRAAGDDGLRRRASGDADPGLGRPRGGGRRSAVMVRDARVSTARLQRLARGRPPSNPANARARAARPDPPACRCRERSPILTPARPRRNPARPPSQERLAQQQDRGDEMRRPVRRGGDPS